MLDDALQQQPVGLVLGATLGLSVDHRVMDGVKAAQFLAELKRLLEEPEELLRDEAGFGD